MIDAPPHLTADSQGVRPGGIDRAQILALSGGGYRGLFTARVLELIEARFGGRIKERFQLIAGTSAGALIAAAVAQGIPAADIRQAFELHGAQIFPRGRLTPVKQLFRSPYGQEGLSAVLDHLFEGQGSILDEPLSGLPLPLLVTAVSVGEHRARVFGGAGLGDTLSYHISLREALLSSAAAPTYFPVREPSGAERLVDGGMVANAPDLVALVHGRRHLALDLDHLYLLSIGTASPSPSAIASGSRRKGILRSLLSTRGLVQLTLDSQERLATRITADLLGERFFRIDRNPSPQEAVHVGAMDRTDERATRTLRSLAEQALDDIGSDARFEAFFAQHQATLFPG